MCRRDAGSVRSFSQRSKEPGNTVKSKTMRKTRVGFMEWFSCRPISKSRDARGKKGLEGPPVEGRRGREAGGGLGGCCLVLASKQPLGSAMEHEQEFGEGNAGQHRTASRCFEGTGRNRSTRTAYQRASAVGDHHFKKTSKSPCRGEKRN